MNNQTYLAGISLGPVIKTISEAENTRSTWAASYFFSRLCRQLAKQIDNSKNKYDLWMPVLVQESNTPTGGTGIYPDRIFFTVTTGDLACIKEDIVDPVLTSIAEEIKCDIEFLRGYLRIAVIAKPMTEEFENPIESIATDLDARDFDYNPWPGEINLLQEYFKKGAAGPDNYSPMFVEAFGSGSTRFASIIEISASLPLAYAKAISPNAYEDLMSRIKSSFTRESVVPRAEEVHFFDDLKKTVEAQYRATCKFVAILTMDGDGVGKILMDISSLPELKAFGNFLNKYTSQATELVKDYGGQMIYAGGDDLFCFCPVTGKDDQGILNLCEALEKKYHTLFDQDKQNFGLTEVSAPTMSFGIYIQYYKAPLDRGIDNAYKLLKEAKEGDKNKLAAAFEPHASSATKGIIPKSLFSYKTIREFVQYYIYLGSDGFNARLKTLEDQAWILAVTATDGYTNNSCSDFLNNTIRPRMEGRGGGTDLNEFIKKITDLVDQLFKDNSITEDQKEDLFDFVLRFARFNVRKDDRYYE